MENRAARGLAAPAPRNRGRVRTISGGPRAGAAFPAREMPTTEEPAGARPSEALPPSLSGLHMRGGLGKTLLLAFLLLAIVPLSLLAFVAYHQVQQDIEQQFLASLETVVSLQGARLVDWVEAGHRDLAFVAAAVERSSPAVAGQEAGRGQVQAELAAQLAALQPRYKAFVLVDAVAGRVLAATDPEYGAWIAGAEGAAGGVDPQLLGSGLVVIPVTAGAVPTPGEPSIRYLWEGKLLVGLLTWEALREVVAGPGLAVEGLDVGLVTAGGFVLSASDTHLASLPAPALQAGVGEAAGDVQGVEALLQGRSGTGAYRDLQGAPVFGAYRWMPELGLGIVAEQAQEQVLAGGDAVTALIIGATLAMALLTAAIAAVVTRRITRPIVQLTTTASWMARGDLSHRVAVTRRDEIGVLAGAFNRMAAELQILYANLEARVSERTAQLAAANEQARYHARQLAISAEVARVASSIRDLPALLSTVVELIGRSFELEQVAIYLLQPKALAPGAAGAPSYADRRDSAGSEAPPPAVGPLAVWQAAPTGRLTRQGALVSAVPDLVRAALEVTAREAQATGQEGTASFGGPHPSGQEGPLPDPAWSLAGRPEMAVSLQVCGRVLGVLHVTGGGAPSLAERDPVIYRSLADQIAIAIENASVYALEHETVRRLQELDRIQSRFLTNMSHALRTPLNSIIGFSRVMLKGLDGSLNDLQRSDLATIHEGGRQLLGLIDDLLELSQWDIAPFGPDQVLPLAEGQEPALRLSEEPALSESQVDLAEIVEGVMATARALARDKPLQLYDQVPGDLPRLQTDSRLVRRLILGLLANAIKFTGQGQIWLVVRPGGDSVTISVRAGGRPDPALAGAGGTGDAQDGPSVAGWGQAPQGAAMAQSWAAQEQVAVARHIVERLGGRTWPAGLPPEETGIEEGDATSFAFSLPLASREEPGLYAQPGGRI